VIITKVGIQQDSPDGVWESINQSAQRLETVPDILMIHNRWEEHMGNEMDACLKQLDRAVNRGLARAIGISNFLPDELEHALSVIEHPFVAYQGKINLIHPRNDVKQLLAICQKYNVPFMASAALDRGNVATSEIGKVIMELATKYNMTQAQIGIFAVLAIGAMPVVQTHDINHLRENMETLKIQMKKDDVEKLMDVVVKQE
jgi:2,5-diketo-D-gluconate reductase B